MQRRELLVRGTRAALSLPFLQPAAPAQRRQLAPNAGADALAADLEKQIPELMEATRVPGLSIAIIRNGKLQWRQGFGVSDAASRKPVDNETMFEAASMSKPVFAYAVMKLCEKGVLDLDTPLTRYTPDRIVDDPRLDLITARHVLSHTSGLQDWRSDKEPLQIHFTPGEKWQYSGEGYFYLQSVVTRLTGHTNRKACARYEAGVEVCATDIDAYLRANLLGPFGMASSGYVWNARFARHLARPHDRSGKPLVGHKSTATDAARYASAGALLTTATDYANFLIEVIDPRGSDDYRLNEASRKEMLRPQVTVTTAADYSISWGLGWRLAQTRTGTLIGHGGDNLGFHSISEASPERKSGYVILTNGDNGPELLKKLSPELSRRLHSLPDSRR